MAVVASIVRYLREGYPDGVPERDYLPIFALLARQLSNEEVIEIADELAAAGDPQSALAIRTAITHVTHEKPLDADIARVSARLAAGGWPLTPPRDVNLD